MVARYQVTIDGKSYGYGATGSQVTAVGQALVKRGFGKHYSVGPGPTWSDSDTLNYADYQKSLGLSGNDADGVPGADSLHKLLASVVVKPPVPPVTVKVSRTTVVINGLHYGYGATGSQVLAVGKALVAKGFGSHYAVGPDTTWTDADTLNYQAFQKSLGYTGVDADGVPGVTSLAKLLGTVPGTPAGGGTSGAAAISINAVTYDRHNAGATSSCSAAVAAIMKLTGRTDRGWTQGYETACTRESSLDPSAINNYDLNAWGPTVADGYPLHCSRGIAQCIPDTFATYHQAGTSTNIYDTIANIAASMNYVIHVYGVAADGSNLASKVQQFDPNRPSKGY